jgi:hypothetical protein
MGEDDAMMMTPDEVIYASVMILPPIDRDIDSGACGKDLSPCIRRDFALL